MPSDAAVPPRETPAPGYRLLTPRPTVAVAGRTLALATGIIAGIWVLERIWPVVIALVVGLMLFATFHPLISHFERKGWGRGWATGALCLVPAMIVAGLALIVIPRFWAEVTGLVADLPRLQKRAVELAQRFPLTRSFAPEIGKVKLGSLPTNSAGHVFELSSRVVAGIGYAVTSLVLAIYFLIDPRTPQAVVYSLTPRRHHLRLARVLRASEVIVGGYVRGQMITSAAVFLFTLGLLAILRVPNALPVAAFAGLTDVVPFVGGLLATTPAALAAISRGPWIVLIVVVAMVVYQEVESRLIVPRVYGHALRLSPPAVIVSLLIGGELMGVMGALLALPFAASIGMLITELRVELPGDDHEAREQRAKDVVVEREFETLAAGESVQESAAIAHGVAAAADNADDDAAGKP
jgi:predicted PurR-regulated permease PerM